MYQRMGQNNFKISYCRSINCCYWWFSEGLAPFVCCFTYLNYVVTIKVFPQGRQSRETTVACKQVLMQILLWGTFFVFSIDTPLKALWPVVYVVILFFVFHIWFVPDFLKISWRHIVVGFNSPINRSSSLQFAL